MPTSLNNLPQSNDELKGRVDGLERDVKSLADSVGRVSTAMEHGFENTRNLINQSHDQIGSEVKELYKLVERAKTPNWQAYGIILGIAFYGITWFVDSKIEPTKELQKGEMQARVTADSQFQAELDKTKANLIDVHAKFYEEKVAVHERLVKLETVNEMRNQWDAHFKRSK